MKHKANHIYNVANRSDLGIWLSSKTVSPEARGASGTKMFEQRQATRRLFPHPSDAEAVQEKSEEVIYYMSLGMNWVWRKGEAVRFS